MSVSECGLIKSNRGTGRPEKKHRHRYDRCGGGLDCPYCNSDKRNDYCRCGKSKPTASVKASGEQPK